jgi:hypothetical protein
VRIFFQIFFFLILFQLPAQTTLFSIKRSFNEIFPDIPSAVREEVFSRRGYCKASEQALPSVLMSSGRSAIDPQIARSVLEKQPGFLVESIMVVPGTANQYSLLDVYNALGKIRGLKGRLYLSATRNEQIPLFEEVTRIESARKTNPIADPAPAMAIPSSETIYMRLKDVNFGNSYYRGDITLSQRGLNYRLSNNRSLTYFLVPVIKEEKFIAQMYFEPIAEGILIYALAGADVSDFVSSRIHMPSAISKRLSVIIEWVAEGITSRAGA